MAHEQSKLTFEHSNDSYLKCDFCFCSAKSKADDALYTQLQLASLLNMMN